MLNRLPTIASAAILAVSLSAPGFAQSASPGVSHDAMGHEAIGKDKMSHDTMSPVSHDTTTWKSQ